MTKFDADRERIGRQLEEGYMTHKDHAEALLEIDAAEEAEQRWRARRIMRGQSVRARMRARLSLRRQLEQSLRQA